MDTLTIGAYILAVVLLASAIALIIYDAVIVSARYKRCVTSGYTIYANGTVISKPPVPLPPYQKVIFDDKQKSVSFAVSVEDYSFWHDTVQ